MQHRDDHLTIVRAATFVHDHEVAIPDLFVDHRVATHAEHVVIAAALDEAFRNGDRFVVRDRHDGRGP